MIEPIDLHQSKKSHHRCEEKNFLSSVFSRLAPVSSKFYAPYKPVRVAARFAGSSDELPDADYLKTKKSAPVVER